MIHLFLDDSGKESSPRMPWVCMAGYLADYEPYVGLLGKWRQLTLRHGIAALHMKDLIPLTGPYKGLGWDETKRDEVICDFISVINETRMFGVGVAVEMAAWQRVKAQFPMPGWRSVHLFCVERIMQRVITQLHAVGVDDTLNLIFDTDPEFGRDRFNLFCAMMANDKRASRRLASISFAHPEYYPGLQAADLLAWETRKNLMQEREGYPSTKRWRAMVTHMPNYHLEYTVGEVWAQVDFDGHINQIEALAALASSEVPGDDR